MSWPEVLVQLELDVAVYERLAVDPTAVLPPPWAPTTVDGPPPGDLLEPLRALLGRLRAAEQALAVARAHTDVELRALGSAAPAPVARYLDTTA